MEQQLRQAQRLEAMGTLAGGIAHDFNNLLGAILGYGEMALRDAPRGKPAASRPGQHHDRRRARPRAGRSHSRVQPQRRRRAGGRARRGRRARDACAARGKAAATVSSIEERLRAGRAAVLGDATQIHQVLMNLVTNAVQAMPSGGSLRVSLDTAGVDGAAHRHDGHARRRRLRRPGGRRLGKRHRAGDHGENLRSVLHHQGSRCRDRARTVARPRHRHRAGRRDRRRDHRRQGKRVHRRICLAPAMSPCRPMPGARDVRDAARRPRARAGRRRRGVARAARHGNADGARILAGGLHVQRGGAGGVPGRSGRFDAVITDESMPGISGSELVRRRTRWSGPPFRSCCVSGYLSAAVVRRATEAGAERGAEETAVPPGSSRRRSIAFCMARRLRRRATSPLPPRARRPSAPQQRDVLTNHLAPPLSPRASAPSRRSIRSPTVPPRPRSPYCIGNPWLSSDTEPCGSRHPPDARPNGNLRQGSRELRGLERPTLHATERSR